MSLVWSHLTNLLIKNTYYKLLYFLFVCKQRHYIDFFWASEEVIVFEFYL